MQTTIGAPTLAKLKQVSTATLTTQLFKRGFRQQFLVGLRPMNPSHARFAGPAYTMRFIPAREDLETLESVRDPGDGNLQWRGVEAAPSGSVLVIDSRCDIRAASMGDTLATRLLRRGVAAMVTDGAVRDGPSFAKLPFPTFAQAMTASTRLSFFHVADLDVPIGCAGVAVYPGDIVVGDAEGVVVVPRHVVESVAEDSFSQEKLEEFIHKKIDAGAPLAGTYPPSEELIAEYNASIQLRKTP
jgi:regulator of RNase E activity RraA